MEERIKQELNSKPASEIKELILDNCRTPIIEGLTDEFENLEVLSIINCGLNSLKNFPHLPKLQKLDLSENKISDGFKILSENAPNLTKIKLANNPINDLSAIESFKNFKHLNSLDFYQCGITKNPKYRDEIFKLISCLIFLDKFDKDEDVEEPETDYDGNDEEFEDEFDDDDDDDDDEDELNGDDSDDEELGENGLGEDNEDDSDDMLEDEEEVGEGDNSKGIKATTKPSIKGTKRKKGGRGDDGEEEDGEDDDDDDDDE